MGRHHVCLPLTSISQQRNKDATLVCGTNSTTGHQLLCNVSILSNFFTTVLSVKPGDVIALAGLATDIFLQALLAITDCGAIACPLNWRWSGQEMGFAIKKVKPALVLADRDCRDLLAESLAALGKKSNHVVSLEQLMNAVHLRAGAQKEQAVTDLQLLSPPSDVALILFTSGTTGSPKGVMLTHTNIHTQSMAKLGTVHYTADDTYLHMAPLFHIGGISSAHAMLMAGAKHVFLPRFVAADALRLMEHEGVSAFIAVPAMLQDMVHAGGGKKMERVRKVLAGAGGMSPALQAAVTSLFPNAVISSAYGMTEACSSITFTTIHTPHHTTPTLPASPSTARHLGGNLDGGVCVGVPGPGVQVRVEPLGEMQESWFREHGLVLGEVWTRGPHVMAGYWGDEEATAKALPPCQWLRTGDLGYLAPDGRLWLKGRAKDMIKSGGENVFAAEVEAVLCSHPAVAAAAVVGLPHERLGEQVSALVVLKPSHIPPPQDLPHQLQAHCKAAGLSHYKLPRVLHTQVEPLPCNASGKVLKHEVVHAMLQATPVRLAGLHRVSKL